MRIESRLRILLFKVSVLFFYYLRKECLILNIYLMHIISLSG